MPRTARYLAVCDASYDFREYARHKGHRVSLDYIVGSSKKRENEGNRSEYYCRK